MKDDERNLLRELTQVQEAGNRHPVRRTIDTVICKKRLHYVLNKWTDKGWWEYGTALTSGWLTEAGLAAGRMS